MPHIVSTRSWRERLTTRLAHLAFLAIRPMTLGVRGLVVDAQDQVLLVRHSYVAGWHLPGGGVEAGESCETALARELAEEANVILDAAPTLHGLFYNATSSRRDHVAVYVVRRFHQTGPRAPDREILQAAFFPLRSLPAGVSSATSARLNEIFDRQAISQSW